MYARNTQRVLPPKADSNFDRLTTSASRPNLSPAGTSTGRVKFNNCRRSENESQIQNQCLAFSLLESVAEGVMHGKSVTHSESVTGSTQASTR